MQSRFLVVFALAAAALVAAQLAPDDMRGYQEDDSERDTQFQLQTNQVQIESEAKAGLIRDKFKLEFKGDTDYVELKMDRDSRNNGTSSRFRFRVRFFGIREYVESDGTPGFSSPSEACGNPSLSLISGNSNGFQFSNLPTTYYYDATNNRNVTIRNFKGQTSNGLFQVIVHLSGGGSGERNGKFRMNGRDVPPTAIKFDIVIDPQGAGYNWKCNNTESRLALVLKTKSASQMGAGTSTSVKFNDPSAALGFFTWAPTVAVAGSATPANVIFGNFVQQAPTDPDSDNDLSSGEASYRATYSFDVARPSKLTWDPELGYLPSGSGPTNPNSGVAVSASLLLITLLAFLQVLFF